MLTVAGIASVIIFLVVAVSCCRNGLYSTIVMTFIGLLSAFLAVSLFVPMARVPLFEKVLSWYAPGICCLGTFVLALVIMQTVANYLLPPRIELPKWLDRIGGTALGLVLALFLTGFLTSGLMMLPGTGGPGDKVVFLEADRFFARSMAWLSGWAGSKPLDAREFLAKLKAERVMFIPRDRGDIESRNENADATRRLSGLWTAIRRYAADNGGAFPQKIEDLTDYLPRSLQKTSRGVAKGLIDPVTGLTYRVFPFKTLDDARTGAGDTIVAWTRGVAGKDRDRFMYLGNNVGKRPVLYATGEVSWETHESVREVLRAQVERVPGEEVSAE